MRGLALVQYVIAHCDGNTPRQQELRKRQLPFPELLEEFYVENRKRSKNEANLLGLSILIFIINDRKF